jgi:hypothetical protein
MRPSSLLAFLCLLSVGGGAWVWSQHTAAIALAKGQLSGDPAAVPGDAAALIEQVKALEKRVKDAETQNTVLKVETEQWRKAAMAVPAPPPAGGTPMANTPTAAVSSGPVTLEQLAKDVENIRGLNFKQPLVYQRISAAALEAKIKAQIEAAAPPALAEPMVRAALALGLAREKFDLIAGLVGLTLEQNGGVYEPATHTFYVDESWDLTERGDLRGRVVLEMAQALLQQHFGTPGITGDNDDATLAARAVFAGDAALTKLKRFMADQLNGAPSGGMQASPFYGAPYFLRQRHLFPYEMSGTFSERLPDLLAAAPRTSGSSAPAPGTASDERRLYDAPFQRIPQSTAEIMHPELWTAQPPFSPEVPSFAGVEAGGLKAFYQNVMGEFGILLLLRIQLAQPEAIQASEGWAGDRFILFPGTSDDAGATTSADHVIWKTRWRSEADAAEFLKSLRTFSLQSYAIPMKPIYAQPDGGLIVNDPTRILRLHLSPDKKGVTLINATSAPFADAAEAWLGGSKE